jgi:aquaporin Z
MNNPKLITEFLGTFFLVTVVAFTGNPLAIGVVLMVLVYSGGHISGAHYNPAVTFAMYLKKAISKADAISYVIAQFLGGLTASVFYASTHQDLFIPQPSGITWVQAAVVEAVFTFLLVRTIMIVATDTRVKGNQYFGLAIGGALMVAAFAGGPLSGGAFNPAVGISPLLIDIQNIGSYISLLLLYSVGPLLGAALAYKVDVKN